MARPKKQQSYQLVKVVIRNAFTQEVMNSKYMDRDSANQYIVFWRVWNHNEDCFIVIEEAHG